MNHDKEDATSYYNKQPVFQIDVSKYEHLLAESDASAEEKQEFLQTLWDIICELMQIGFHIHPVQQARDAQNCGKQKSAPCALTQADSNALDSVTSAFNATPIYKEV